MGKSSTARKPSDGQFVGIGRSKSGRRANAAAGSKSDRKYYVYETKEQKGTAIGRDIRRNAKEYEEQFNAMRNHPNGLVMKTNEATGRLSSRWNRIYNKMTKSSAIGKYIDKNGGTMKKAKVALQDIAGAVHFGADPRSK